ncbi:fibroleukin-like [Anneissia japonica]|uniref:fibroleukin-like n=1 Tax=Anneissia japonica TaxID=1529436 RepID=UPI001425A4FA|nr:fibroleukin-like [Anneissia japonica]
MNFCFRNVFWFSLPANCIPACVNGGICSVVKGVAMCDCTGTGYTGTSCETELVERAKRLSNEQVTGQEGNISDHRSATFVVSKGCENELQCGDRDSNPLQSTAQSSYKDCTQFSAQARAKSGVYAVTDGTETFLVKCEMVNNEGWTVLQKRENSTSNFNRTWEEYKWGFGNINADF